MKKLFSFLQKTEFFLGSLGLLLAIILTFCQVVNRYWLHFEIMWISDAALYIFIFTIYVAISYGAAVKTHIAVDILPDVLCKNSRAKRALFDMAKSAVTVAMILAMWSPTLRVVKRAWKHPEFA
ncbi:TRAP transporter small permease, partial [Pyramidobacter porci]